MKLKNPILSNAIFNCYHLELTVETNNDIENFQVDRLEAKGILDYLQQNAVKEENQNEARTYLVYDKATDELVAYFTLKAGLVLKSPEIIKEYTAPKELGDSFDALSGIELAYFGVNAEYKRNHPNYKHYGILVFSDFIYVLAQQTAKIVGAPILHAYSVDDGKLLKHYIDNYGFDRLSEEYETKLHSRFRPHVDDRCIFIFQKLDLN